ncbi:energy transducer TonB [Sphingopyxis sp. 22461]
MMAAIPSPVLAQWQLSSGVDNCAVTGEYSDDGNSAISMVEYVDGGFILFVENQNWSIVEDRKYPLKFLFDDTLFTGDATGYVFQGSKGFKIGGGADMADAFAKSSRLIIYKDEATIVLVVKLTGTMAGLARVKPCIAKLRREHQAALAEQRALEAKRKIIAADPFADQAPPNPPGDDAAEPIGNAGRWMTFDDYPSRAMREGREGAVGFKLSVDAEGRPSACEITMSSGHADLDAETCTLVTRRARFKPSPGSRPRYFESRVTWSIPR